MESVILGIQILPGKTEAVRKMYQTIQKVKWKEYVVSQKKSGVEKERDFLQTTPRGDIILIYMEAKDIRKSFAIFATSKDPVDVWIKNEVKSCTDVDFNEPGEGPLPELLLAYDK
jgi:hypothetical protein